MHFSNCHPFITGALALVAASAAHADVSGLPILPNIDANMKAHLQSVLALGQSQAQPNKPNVFAKLGDSISESGSYMMDIGCAGATTFGAYSSLQSAVTYFSSATFPSGYTSVWCGVANSFTRASMSAVAGWTTNDAMAPTSACGAPNNSYFRCELQTMKPAFALIMYGTNDLERYSSGQLPVLNLKSLWALHWKTCFSGCRLLCPRFRG